MHSGTLSTGSSSSPSSSSGPSSCSTSSLASSVGELSISCLPSKGMSRLDWVSLFRDFTDVTLVLNDPRCYIVFSVHATLFHIWIYLFKCGKGKMEAKVGTFGTGEEEKGSSIRLITSSCMCPSIVPLPISRIIYLQHRSLRIVARGQNIARVQNYPDIKKFNSCFGHGQGHSWSWSCAMVKTTGKSSEYKKKNKIKKQNLKRTNN